MLNLELAKAAEHIATHRSEFALETKVIRGVTQRVFKNAPCALSELLAMATDAHGDCELLVHGGERLTYRTFSEKVETAAAALQGVLGINPGDRLAIAMRNRVEYLIFAMAAAAVGAVVVHLNAWWTSEELDYALSDCRAQVVLADTERLERLRRTKRLSDLCLVAVEEHADAAYSFQGLLALGQNLRHKPPSIETDDDCSIIYTSGSTGHPKGVLLTHRNIISAIWSWLMIGPVQEHLLSLSGQKTGTSDQLQPANLVTVPFFHVSGMNTCFLLSLAMGGKVVILDKWDAEQAADLIAKERITRFWGVPTMTADLLALHERARGRLVTLGSLDAGGAKRPPDQVRRIVETHPSIPPSTGYGMTETSGLGLRVSGAEYTAHPDAAGHLLPPLQDMQIVDEDGVALAYGQVGELVLKSPAVMRGYLNQPEATAAALRDGWLRTGDLAKVDENGLVFVVGRKKDIIIRGGENISVLEVESALHDHPGVVEAAVFSVPDERLGEIVGVALHCRDSEGVELEELRAFLARRIALFKLPERLWLFFEPLARGSTEKIDRRAVRRICLNLSFNS